MTENSYNQFIGSILFLRSLTLISLNSSMHPLSVSKNHEMCVCLPGVSSARAEAPQLLTPSRRQLFRVRDQGVPTEVFPKSLGWQWGNQSHQREGKQRIGEKAGNHSNLHCFFFSFRCRLFSLLFSYSKMNLICLGEDLGLFLSTRWESGRFTSPADPAACVSFMNSSLSLSYEFLHSRMNSLNFSEGLPLSDVQCRSLQLIPDAEEWPDRLSTWVSWWLWCGDLGWTPQ